MRRSHSTQAQSTASHCRLTSPMAECSQMRRKVSFDWLPSYITATRPVHEIFKMAGYFLDSPRTSFKATNNSRQLAVPNMGDINKITFTFQQPCKHAAKTYYSSVIFESLVLQFVLPYYLRQFLHFKHVYNVISILKLSLYVSNRQRA